MLNDRLVVVEAAVVLCPDIDPHDLSVVFEQVSHVTAATPPRTAELRARYLALHLDALRHRAPTARPPTQPGRAPRPLGTPRPRRRQPPWGRAGG